MAFKKTERGLGPAVYLLIIQGSTICKGTIGTASRARRSLGMPVSISFNVVTASVAAKPIWNLIITERNKELY